MDATTVALHGPGQGLPRRRVVFGAVGMIMVLGGQLALVSIQRRPALEGPLQLCGGLALMAGLLLFGAAAKGRWRQETWPLAGSVQQPASVSAGARKWMAVLIGVAITSGLAALAVFADDRTSPLAVWLWLSSIVALLASQASLARTAMPAFPHVDLPHYSLLLTILAYACFSRFYRLTDVPLNLDGDLASVGLQARALVSGGGSSLFGYAWAGIPVQGYLPSVLTMSWNGTGLLGLRTSGALAGLILILATYLLGRELFHRRVGLLASAVLALSYSHIAASREALYIDPAALGTVSLYFLVVGLRRRSGLLMVLSGIAASLTLQTYFSGRLLILVAGLFLAYAAAVKPRAYGMPSWHVTLCIGSLVVALGPMLVVFSEDPGAFMWRTREVLVLHPTALAHMQNAYRAAGVWEVILEQARRTALLFHYYPDSGTQFGLHAPFLDPISAISLSLGSGVALFNMRRQGSVLVLLWTALTMFAGGLLTSNAPYWPRLLVMFAPVAVLVGLGVNSVWEFVMGGAKRPVHRALVMASFVAVGSAIGNANWNMYVHAVGSYATPRTLIGRYLAAQPDSTRAGIISQDFRFGDREFEFLAPGRFVCELETAHILDGALPVSSLDLIILTPEFADLLPILQQDHAGAAIEVHEGNVPEEVAFYAVRLP